MRRYVLRRLLAGAVLLWFVVTLTFVLIQAAPGSPIDYFMDARVPTSQMDRLREVYGLDQPLLVQYLRWLRNGLFAGHWGVSFFFQEPPEEVIARALPATMLLAFAAMIAGYAMGVGAGIWAASRPGSLIDRGLRLLSLSFYSVPAFWLGLMMILVFSGFLRLAPAGGMSSPFAGDLPWGQRALDTLAHLALPALTLALPISTVVARLLRSSLLDVLGQDFIRNARSRGVGELRILSRHALKNCLGPLVQVAGVQLPALLGGALVVEYVFSWPGLGRATITAIEARDYPLVLAITVFTGALVILGNLVADLVHAWLDPRVREGGLA